MLEHGSIAKHFLYPPQRLGNAFLLHKSAFKNGNRHFIQQRIVLRTKSTRNCPKCPKFSARIYPECQTFQQKIVRRVVSAFKIFLVDKHILSQKMNSRCGGGPKRQFIKKDCGSISRWGITDRSLPESTYQTSSH